jgi:hypothetical protein
VNRHDIVGWSIAGLAYPVRGLLAEEVDPATSEMLGTFPQAFSHIGPVNAAWAIAEAKNRGRCPKVSTNSTMR